MKKMLLLGCLALAACAEVMSPAGEYTIDDTAFAAITMEHMALTRPCNSTTTTVCVDASLSQKLQDSRVLLNAALTNYQTARKAYNDAIASGSTSDSAAVDAAYSSLQSAISNANTVLSLETVKEILAKIKGE